MTEAGLMSSEPTRLLHQLMRLLQVLSREDTRQDTVCAEQARVRGRRAGLASRAALERAR